MLSQAKTKKEKKHLQELVYVHLVNTVVINATSLSVLLTLLSSINATSLFVFLTLLSSTPPIRPSS